MKGYIVRDKDGTLKCFHRKYPVRHFNGRWESKPRSPREYLVIPEEEQTPFMLGITWETEPRSINIIFKK